jgi:hypothetical protein
MKTLLPSSLQQQVSLYKLNRAIAASRFHPVNWKPFPNSPQEAAYYSEADELFYGGAAGGGKTDLGLGLAGTQHQRSVIFRRVFPSVRGMIERSREIYNYAGDTHARDSFNEGLHIWRLNDGRIIEFGSCQYEKDKEKQRGIPRDLYVFDELPEFSESQFRFIKIWNRTADPNQRCRVLCTGNPPTTPEGEWVVRYWAPWLDPDHPNPAEPGELRWFAVIDGEDVEVESSKSFMHNGEEIFPRSRTFIPARLQDNPVYMETGYLATLQALPEPLRSQMLYGDFSVGTDDDSWQVIPTAWILEAERRYREGHRPAVNCRSIGVDPSRGGDDEFAIARLYGSWYEVDAFPGSEAPDGESGAMLVEQVMTHPAPMWVDAIGYGASVYDALKHTHEAAPGQRRRAQRHGRPEWHVRVQQLAQRAMVVLPRGTQPGQRPRDRLAADSQTPARPAVPALQAARGQDRSGEEGRHQETHRAIDGLR